MKKLPLSLAQKEIFSEKSGQLVQPQGHAALLAGSSVLVQNTLVDSLVNQHDSLLVSILGNSAVAGIQSGLELLDDSLHLRLVSLVLLISNFGTDNILLRGLDVGHGHTSYSSFYAHAFTHYNATSP